VTREEFAAQCERGALQVTGLPVTSAVLRWTAEQLKRGEPPWWKGIAKAWEKRKFVAWTEAWSLYLACLHFEALNDAECPLVPYFPSCGGTAEADPSVAVNRFLHAPSPTFYDNLRARHRRTYVAGRALLWLNPALLFFQKRRMPYYLVQVNAGAGLDLAADLIMPQKGFRSDLIDARVGLEPEPLIIEDILHRRWLTAGVYPDNVQAIQELDQALEKVSAANKEDASFIQLAPCPPEKAPAFIAKNIQPEEEEGLLVFNMGATVRMTDAEYAAFAKGMAGTLSKWGDRGLWVEVESVRGETYSTTFQLRAHRVQGGQLRSMVLAALDMESGKHAYSEASEAFLAPAAPAA
jgi:hypothetical protein